MRRTASRRGQQVPGGVRQPLLAPAPVVVGASRRMRQVEVDAVRISEARGDAVDDAAGGVGVFVGIEEAVLRVVAADAGKQRGVERIEAEDPVELILRIAAEAAGKGGVVGVVRNGAAAQRTRATPGARLRPATTARSRCRAGRRSARRARRPWSARAGARSRTGWRPQPVICELPLERSRGRPSGRRHDAPAAPHRGTRSG